MNWDSQLVAFFNQGLAHPLLDGLMVTIAIGAMPLAAIMPLLLVLVGKQREGIALLVTFIVSTLLAVGIQFLVMRPRPVDIRAVQIASAFPSFPSGHAAAALSGATLVSLVGGGQAWPCRAPSCASRLISASITPAICSACNLGRAVATAVYGCWYRPVDITRPR